MTKSENYQSRFVAAFINDYFEKQIYSYFPDKDRLLYVLCESDEEKQKKTSEQINSIKKSIIDLGFEEQSYAIILSSRPESREYIEEKNRIDFWVNNLTELFEDSITGFNPITEAYGAVDDAAIDLEKESKFWEMFPNSQKPKNQDVKTIIPYEIDLIELINNNILEYLIKGDWDIDFDEFENYVELSKPMELLFSMSDLLVQHYRLEMFEEFLHDNKASLPQPIITKAENLKEQLNQYNFFELEKVKVLSEQSQFSLMKKISENGLPYAIAMFDYLQFIQYLEKQHFDSKYKLNKEVSKWLNSDKEGRAVKGNISSLLKNTTENKARYTAYKHKENVTKDYEQLK